MANTGRGRKPIKRGADQRTVDRKNFRLADEVRYILGRAAEHDGRVITIGQIILFSTETGDASLLDPTLTPLFLSVCVFNKLRQRAGLLAPQGGGRACTGSGG